MSISLFAPIPPEDGPFLSNADKALTEVERRYWLAMENAAKAQAARMVAEVQCQTARPGMPREEAFANLTEPEETDLTAKREAVKLARTQAEEAYRAFACEVYGRTDSALGQWDRDRIWERAVNLAQVETARLARERRAAEGS